ncbi:mitochondrial carrier domain-containing protein [Aspergillus pseudoustus]|uniref:Mitochondrial carrier domain-containing protein n=1 Tax=Aspergillus pseudoustus TaxID=1810923 RepID=A0ABR4J3D0_9EURO
MDNSNLDIWLSGAVAVVTVDFLVYPFDTLKTRIQSPNYTTIYKDAATNTIRKAVLFRGLYQGVFSVVLSTIPASGAFFTTYENAKAVLNKSKQSHSLPTPVTNALSSSAAESVSCLLLTPAEVIKQNAQVINNAGATTNNNADTSGDKSGHGKKGETASGGSARRSGSVTLQVLRRFKSHPWRLWSGYSALLGRNLPFTGLNFPIFEFVKGELVKYWQRHHSGLRSEAISPGRCGSGEGRGSEGRAGEPVLERAVLTGVAASISGSIASVVTTPIDVVKTRMMLAASADDTGSSTGTQLKSKRARSIRSVGKEIFRNEGSKGLFRGGAIRVVWTAVSLSIYLSIYEGGRFYLEKKRREKKKN